MKKIIAVMMILAAVSVSAQDLKTVKDTERLSDQIVDKFYNKEFREGLKIAGDYWPLPKSELENLETQIKSQWVIIEERFGKTTGYELIQKEKIGSSFYRYHYLQKFENHAIYWSITYYKPEDKWVINSIFFKDDLEFLFKPVN